MAFNPYYQNPYYPQPMPDNLMQMRQQQMMQPAPPPVPQNPVATSGVQGPMGNFAQIMQQFNQFKANFRGDPKAEVEKLLQSGKLNQQQLNQLQQMAKQFQSLMQ